MAAGSPFHEGERRVQERLGVRAIERWARKAVRPCLPEQHRSFYAGLPFLVAAARDREGRPWATLLAGAQGFVRSPDPRSLAIDAQTLPGDALEGALVPGADLGLLGIELATRRRNRVNGRIVEGVEAGVLALEVDQAFGNCPQYIREREWRWVGCGAPRAPRRASELSGTQSEWIESADTFFIASGHRSGEDPAFGMDASHRGGDPGFVRVEGARRIVFPDYAGNDHFNTIGNLVVDPRVGLAFVDFGSGSLLQITGRARIDWGSPAVAATPGARRLVRVDVDEVVELREALPLRWQSDAAPVRSLRVVEKKMESAEVASFVLEARDGGPRPGFEAGQHLPIELEIPGVDELVRRTYSLSGAPGAERMRISVKRDLHGLVSRHLHDAIEVAAILSAGAPAGDFVLPDDPRPVVLVSAGVGVTPLLSMLHVLAAPADARPVWFVHGVRDGAHHALAEEVRALARSRPGIRTCISYSRPRPEDRAGVDYDREGRVDGALLASLVPSPVASEAHFMLCGPTGFMAAIQEALEAQGVLAERIHWERFSQ